MGINSEYYKEKNKKRLTKLKEIEKAAEPFLWMVLQLFYRVIIFSFLAH